MKIKIFFIFINTIILSLFLVDTAGALTYNRIPEGNIDIEQPISINGEFDPEEDVPEGTKSFMVYFQPMTGYDLPIVQNMPCRNGSTTFNEITELGQLNKIISQESPIWKIIVSFYPDLNCVGGTLDNFPIDEIGFTVLDYSIPPRPTWGSINTEQISEITKNVGNIFTDLWSIIIAFLALPLSMWLMNRILTIPPKENKKDDRSYNSDKDVKILKRARLNYEAGKLDQRNYEEILEKYSKK